ncbi:hypothetical protein [Streptomyces sp. NPDC002889]|uniref:hypothetical protein n=1 Tax=Streptomyces sp. NPDC002889 TaxID=3364669 RepID=UPI003696C1AF
MARKLTGTRRLVVDTETVYMWSVRHRHSGNGNTREGCRTVLALRREGTQERLDVTFREGPGRIISEGFAHSGAVASTGGEWHNLYEPGVARRLVDAATERGLLPTARGTTEVDGWLLYDAVPATVPAGAPSSPPQSV